MYVYEWDKQKLTTGLIARMEVRDAYRGTKEAVLFAQPDAEPAKLHHARKLLHNMGLSVTPAKVDGKPVLKVRGFKELDFLARVLEENGVQPLHSVQVSQQKEKESSKGFVARVKANSLKLSGLVWMVGDGALILSGLRRKDVNEAMAGLGYGSTSVVAAVWGNRKVEHLCDEVYNVLLTEFSKDGYRLPHGKEATVRQLGNKGNLLSRVEKFLYDNPSQVISAVNVLGGYHVYRAGRTQNNLDKTFAGILMMTGMMTGLVVPEKTQAEKWEKKAAADGKLSFTLPEEVPETGIKGTLQKAWDFVRERPLRIGGYLSMVNNLFMIKGAAHEWGLYGHRHNVLEAASQGKWDDAQNVLHSDAMKKISVKERQQLESLMEEKSTAKAKKILKKHENSKGTWHFNLVAAASYLLGNWLFSISSSRATAEAEGEKDVNRPFYDMAAMFILEQPKEMRDAALDKVTTIMAEQKGMDIHPFKLKQKINERLAEVAENPWFKPKHRTFSARHSEGRGNVTHEQRLNRSHQGTEVHR